MSKLSLCKRVCFVFFALTPSVVFAAVPVINNFSPKAGTNGTTINITGANFGTFPSNNIVYFGAVRATVNSVSHNTNLSVTVPSGATYAPITVLVNGLVAYSSKPFEPTFSGNGGGFDATSLAPAITFDGMPSGPQQVAIGDMDGDGKPDLIINDCYSHIISLFRNISSGGLLTSNSFAARVDLPAVGPADGVDRMYDVKVGDVDGDGKLDIVTFDRIANQIIVYRNISAPGSLDTNSFAPPVFFNVDSDPRGIVITDVDGDGRPDIVFSCGGPGEVSVLRNIGVPGTVDTNSFAPPVSFAAGAGSTYTAVADLDGDGKPDIITVNSSASTVSIFRNLSTPGVINSNSFAPQVVLPAPSTPIALAVGDIDGDGKADLVVGGYFGPLAVYRNTSTVGTLDTNSFAARVEFAVPGRCHTIALGDLNGDGKVDIALVTELNSALSLFENVSSPGTFTSNSLAPRVDYVTGYNAWGVAVGDLDGDGRPDIAFGNAYATSMWVYQNTMGTAGSTAPAITQQPGDQTVSVGGTAHFSVTATGSPTLFYQWYFGLGDLIPGANSSSLILSNVQPSNAGNYFVLVSNVYGSTLSSNALLTVTNGGGGTSNLPPVITQQPSNQTVSAGGTAHFSVTATGSPTLHYQWFTQSLPIPGAVNSTLTLSNVQPSNAGNYFVIVSNLFGYAVSSNAVLTVTGGTTNGSCTPPPSGIAAWWPGEGNGNHIVNGNNAILEDGVTFAPGEVSQAFELNNPTNGFMHVPASPSLNVGTGAGMTMEGWINVSSVDDLHPIAEWYGNIRGAIGVQLWINAPGTSGALWCALVGTNGERQVLVSTNNALRAGVFQHVALTYDPVSGIGTLYINGAVAAQSNVGSFVPQTTYDLWIGHRPFDMPGDVTYNADLGGALDEFSLYNRALNQGEIRAIFNAGSSGKCTSPSETAPLITHQPTNQTVSVGGMAHFSVTATGSPTLHYQWYRSVGPIRGETAATLTLSNVQPSDAGPYFVRVTNSFGFAISSNAILTVIGETNSDSCTPPPRGLVAWWRAENNADDSVGGNNGTINGAVGFSPGEVGQAFNFTNGANGVLVPASPSLNVQSFTIEAWINPTDVSDFHPILEYGADTGLAPVQFLYGWNDPAGTTPGALFGILRDTNGMNLIINSPGGILPANQWSHVAMTFDFASQRATLYLNGNPVGSNTFSGVLIPQTALPVHLGYRPITSGEGRAGDRLTGGLDEVSVYNRALGQSEIEAIFNAGSDGKCISSTTTNLPPVITQQPTNQTVAVGGTAHFSVTATGSPTLHYQWYRRPEPIFPPGLIMPLAGATNSTLIISNVQVFNAVSNVQVLNAGMYFVVVSNAFGSVTSSNAVLTVIGSQPGRPIILRQPTNQTVSVGGTAHFSVLATSYPLQPLFYQWYFGRGTGIPGATSSTLTLSNVQPSDAGNYYVVVSDLLGSVTSTNAALTVIGETNGGGDCTPPPRGLVAWWKAEGNGNDSAGTNNGTLLGGLGFTDGEVGQAFDFTNGDEGVQVPASPSLNVQSFTIEAWINPTDVSDFHPILEYGDDTGLAPVQFIYGWNDPAGTTPGALFGALRTTNGSALIINSPGGILPANQWSHVAMTFDFGSQRGTLYLNGNPVGSNIFSGVLIPQTALPVHLGYRPNTSGEGRAGDRLSGGLDEVSIYNRALGQNEIQAIFNAGSEGKCTSTTTSNTPPVIRQQPTNQIVAVGGTARFSVTAAGSPTLNYQWYDEKDPAVPPIRILGATNSSLTLSNVQPIDAGNYFVVVSNSFGSAISSRALLTVTNGTNGGGGDCTPPPSGLVGWWPGEGNADDVIGGDNGTLEGGATFAAGKVGEGFRLDGTNAYVQIPDSAALKPTNVTVEAWVWLDPNLPSNRGGEQIVFKKNTWSAWFEGYSLSKQTIDNGNGTSSDRFQFVVSRDGDQVVINSQTIAQRGVWYHVAATYDGNQSILYVNGVAEASATPGFALDYDTTPIFIGTTGTWAPYLNMFGGILDEVSIYNRALTASEIQAIFNAGSNGKCTSSTTSNQPPVITQQPTNQTVAVGGTAHFSVTASGSPALNYQWWHGPLLPVAPTVKIIGATNSALTLSNVQPADAGNYFVIVSNALGTAVSSNAVLTVSSNTLPNAIVQVVNTSAHSDTTFDVPINLVAKGNENALSFSLYFNSSMLSFSNAVLGTGATNGLILVNSSQAAGGVVGVELALPSGQTFNPGTQQVARVTFHSTSTLSSNSVVTPVSFTGKPVALLLSDAQGQSLSAMFLNGFVTILSSSSNGLEGDVSPRPSGDGKLNVFDWVQVGRFVAGLDTISNASEFQRVDCAPRNTLGDGQIKITDWVQAGRYAAGLDPATPAGGPTGPSISNIVSIAKPNVPSSRQVMVNSGSTVKGLTTTVPISIQAQGNEAGLAFSLNFDPTVLKYVSATTGSATSGATLVVNANQADSGKLALVIALPGGGQLPAGLDEIAQVTFMAIGTGNNSVSFADQPVFRSISDANAVELTANYIANSVVVNPQPTVNLSPSGKTSTFSWPAWAGDFKLQSANSLMPPLTWTDVPVTLQTNGDNVQVTVPAPNGQTFYRLAHP